MKKISLLSALFLCASTSLWAYPGKDPGNHSDDEHKALALKPRKLFSDNPEAAGSASNSDNDSEPSSLEAGLSQEIQSTIPVHSPKESSDNYHHSSASEAEHVPHQNETDERDEEANSSLGKKRPMPDFYHPDTTHEEHNLSPLLPPPSVKGRYRKEKRRKQD